jgi:photosystem II stability/assembly factor-like uncharacterized protein
MKILIPLLLYISLSSYAQWIPLGIETQSSFRAIKTFKNHVWIGGTKGTVIHSADQGETWSIQQVVGADKLDFRDLVIINDQEVILMSAGLSQEKAAKLYKTTNAGQTWEILYETNEPGYFFDAITWNQKSQEGLIVSDPKDGMFTFFKLTAKGKNIKQQTGIHFPSLLTREAAFAASGSSLISTPSNDYFLVTGGSQKARIYQSKDKGRNWITRAEVCCTDSSSGFFSIAAKNKQHLMAAGGNYLRIHENSLPMMESIDGGEKWSPLPNSPDFYIEKIIYSKPYWIVTGPSRSAAYHEELKEWRKLPESHFHNIIQVSNMLIGVGGKGQLGKLPIAQIDALFLSKK